MYKKNEEQKMNNVELCVKQVNFSCRGIVDCKESVNFARA